MALFFRRTILISVPKHGTIKIVPHGGRKVSIEAPDSLYITDKKGRPLARKRPSRLTKPTHKA
jgi:hypothetical protein